LFSFTKSNPHRLFDDFSSPGKIGHCGLRGIFCTQSNDFVLALPVIEAIYYDRPAWVGFLYLVAPFQLIVLNPIGFVLMELGALEKQVAASEERKRKKELGLLEDVPEEGNEEDEEDVILDEDLSKGVDYYAIFKKIVTNPLVFMSFFGIVGNFIFGGVLPEILDTLLATVGQAFTPCSLFLLGHAMVDKVGNLSAPRLVLPILLVVGKVLLLGVLCFVCVSIFTNNQDLKMYAFVYGTVLK